MELEAHRGELGHGRRELARAAGAALDRRVELAGGQCDGACCEIGVRDRDRIAALGGLGVVQLFACELEMAAQRVEQRRRRPRDRRLHGLAALQCERAGHRVLVERVVELTALDRAREPGHAAITGERLRIERDRDRRRLDRLVARAQRVAADDGGGGEPEHAQTDRDGARAPARRSSQLGEQRIHRRESPGGLGREPAQDDRVQLPRDVTSARRTLDPAFDHRVGQRDGRLAGKRPVAVQRVIERDAERELIRPLVGALAEVLLGRHEHRRAHHRAGAGQRAHRARRRIGRRVCARWNALVDAERAGEPEVRDAHASILAEQHVVGLEVAMNEACGVSGGEPASGGDELLDDLAARMRPFEPRAERSAVEQLLGEKHELSVDADLVHRDHVWVRDARHRLTFAQHPHALLVGRGRGAQDLERDVAIRARDRARNTPRPCRPRRACRRRRSGRPWCRGRARRRSLRLRRQ